MPRILIFVVVFVLVTTITGTQAKSQASKKAVPEVTVPAAAASANEEVIKLAKAGMTDEIILAVVAKTDRAKYDTSVDALLKFKEAGVSQRVIAAILGISTAPVSDQSTPAVGPVTGSAAGQRLEVSLAQTPTQSVEGIEAGIYWENSDKLIQLEPAVFSGGKTGGKFLGSITGLAKSSIKAVVRSEKAGQRIQTSTPAFYFYFENKSAGLSNTGGSGMFTGFLNGASSPNEFVLARMSVDRNERSIVTSESWAFSDRSGIRSRDTIEFSVERVRAGMYKVMPRTPLTSGEYCFFFAAGNLERSGGGKLFDFGVDAAPASQ